MRKSEICPDCGRHKAMGPDETAHGGCDKWYAVKDPEAKAECEAVKAARIAEMIFDDDPEHGDTCFRCKEFKTDCECGKPEYDDGSDESPCFDEEYKMTMKVNFRGQMQ